MEEHGTRCPEPGCGMPLLPVPNGSGPWRRRAGQIAGALMVLVVAVVLYGRLSTAPQSITVVVQPSLRAGIEAALSSSASTSQSPDDGGWGAGSSSSSESGDGSSSPDSTASAVAEGGAQCPVDKEQTVWDHASCSLVQKCWGPEDSCYLSDAACARITQCNGVQNVASPGVQKP